MNEPMVTVYGGRCGDCGVEFDDAVMGRGEFRRSLFPVQVRASQLRDPSDPERAFCGQCGSHHVLFRVHPDPVPA